MASGRPSSPLPASPRSFARGRAAPSLASTPSPSPPLKSSTSPPPRPRCSSARRRSAAFEGAPGPRMTSSTTKRPSSFVEKRGHVGSPCRSSSTTSTAGCTKGGRRAKRRLRTRRCCRVVRASTTDDARRPGVRRSRARSFERPSAPRVLLRRGARGDVASARHRHAAERVPGCPALQPVRGGRARRRRSVPRAPSLGPLLLRRHPGPRDTVGQVRRPHVPAHSRLRHAPRGDAGVLRHDARRARGDVPVRPAPRRRRSRGDDRSACVRALGRLRSRHPRRVDQLLRLRARPVGRARRTPRRARQRSRPRPRRSPSRG